MFAEARNWLKAQDFLSKILQFVPSYTLIDIFLKIYEQKAVFS